MSKQLRFPNGIPRVQVSPQQEEGTTVLFNIKSLADLRAALYTLLPIVSTLLVTYGVFTADKAQLWGALVTAVLGPVIAAFNAKNVSSVRTALYAVSGTIQALLVGYNLVTAETFSHWLPLLVALVGTTAAVPAVVNTDTTPAVGTAPSE